jgi:hypothetical protein
MSTLLFYITVISSLVTIFIWLRDEFKIIRDSKRYYKVLYPIIFIVLSFIAIGQYYQINQMREIENEAELISKEWPTIDEIKFISKGERLGIIFAGQTFLEKYKEYFPDTYIEFQKFKEGRLGDYSPKNEYPESSYEYDNLEDVCGATITIVKNLTKNNQ